MNEVNLKSGFFKFKDPITKYVKDNIEYSFVSDRALSEIKDSAGEPLKTIYSKIGLSEEIYNQHVAIDEKIYVLRDKGNNYWYVPKSYILELPDTSGNKYVNKLLVVNLGPLPVDYNLQNAKDSVADALLKRLNLKVSVVDTENSSETLVSDQDDDVFRKRVQHGSNKESSYEEKYHKLLKEYDELRDLLENVNNGLTANIEDLGIKVIDVQDGQ